MSTSTPSTGALPRRRQQETRTTMSLNAEARSEGNTEPLQNRFTSKYKNTTKSFKDGNEKEESPREALEDPDFDEYQDEEGRNKDDKSKTKVSKNQTRTQSSSLIGPSELPGSMLLERICPAAPDRSGKEAVTRSKQKATYHETRRLSRNDSEGEWGV